MAFSRGHLIIISTYFLLVFIPYAASLNFNLPTIRPRNQNRDVIVEGVGAYISDSGVQLTPDQIGSNRTWTAGRMTYIRPLHLWDKTSRELASFVTTFSFVIYSNSTAYGDGLAFFLVENNSEITPSAAMGRPINYPSVSVEFDTYWNPEWDPTDSRNNSVGDHVGININSLNSSSSQKWFSNVTGGRECQAWITYDSVSKNLSVSFTGFRNNTVVRQVGLYDTIDLRDRLPEWVIFGFSAGTGGLFQTNNVRSWTFNSSDLQVHKNPGVPPTPGPAPVNENKIGVPPTPGPAPVNENNNGLPPNPRPVSGNNQNSMVRLTVGPSVLITSLVMLAFVL